MEFSKPKTARAYHVHSPSTSSPNDRFTTTLVLKEDVLPELSAHEVLVQIHAVSLNWRDIMIATDTYIRAPAKPGIVPCSDGAGVVKATGPEVTRFGIDDRVVALFFPLWISGLLSLDTAGVALGSERDGMLREYAVFDEEALIKFSEYLSFEEASTLPCAGLTAWNALFGHGPHRGVGRYLLPGETVLTQGTGAVSLFAAQFALAAGADVISTTSSSTKAQKIRDTCGISLEKIINYVENPEWGAEAKSRSRDGKGVDFVVEVVGSPPNLAQTYTAIRPEAQVSVIGTRGVGTRGVAKSDGSEQAQKRASQNEKNGFQDLSSILLLIASTRRIAVGNREMFASMNAFLDEKKIKPVVNPRVFDFEEAAEAFMYLWKGSHFGNVVIRIKH